MANYPQPIKQREELNLRLGIKSSLSQLRSVIASLYVIYSANEKQSGAVFSKETTNKGFVSIQLDTVLSKKIASLYGDSFSQLVEKSPLFTSQLESLQVGIELFFHLGKIDFVETGLSERIGSSRYQKQINFATNMILIDLYLSSYSKEDVNKMLFSWLKDESFPSKLETGLRLMLNTFTEETQFKIRDDHASEIVFNQEGVYAEILTSDEVASNDTKEPVGPFRVYKSFLSSGLHPFIVENKQKIRLQNSVQKEDMKRYANMVETSLSLIPKRTIVTQEALPGETNNGNLTDANSSPQIIFYGAPGTGKSHEIKEKTKGQDVIRTTFHPDSDYSTFVGCYKPTMDDSEVNVVPVVVGKDVVFNDPATYKEKKIVYEFTKQAFLKAYLKAWKKLTEYQDIDRKFKVGGDQYVIIAISDDSITVKKIKADDSEHKEVDDKIVIKKTELEDIYNNPNDNNIEKNNIEEQNAVDEIKQSRKEENNQAKDENEQKQNDDLNNGIKEKIKGIDPNSFDEAWTKIYNSFQIPQFLIIEEINRGNCAQIFGDIFQLLDRQNTDYSEYPIEADSDIRDAIAKAFKEEDEYKLSKDIDVEGVVENYTSNYGATLSKDIQEGRILLLPKNLYIWATMNTSDQSLFPMDSAFKRRWEWEYVPIDYNDAKQFRVKIGDDYYNWSEIIKIINDKIKKANSSADKQLGNRFVKAGEDGVISTKTFVNKVLFYLWNDVFKDVDDDDQIFKCITYYEDFFMADDPNDLDADKINIGKVKRFIEDLNNGLSEKEKLEPDKEFKAKMIGEATVKPEELTADEEKTV